MLSSSAQSLTEAAELFRLGRLPIWRRLVGRGLACANTLIGRHRYDAYRLERVEKMPVLVIPSVFNPKLLRTGAFLAAQLDDRHLSAATRVLDMGCGSGVCAIAAARVARRVLAVDINPAAVRCTNVNSMLNGCADRIEARQGDLFVPVRGERFDRILFNPPFVRARARNDRDRAWRSENVAERFAAQLPEHLRPGGYALVLLSSFGDPGYFLHEFAFHGLAVSACAERRYVNERLVLLRIEPPAGTARAKPAEQVHD